jgi:hypothetical protein
VVRRIVDHLAAFDAACSLAESPRAGLRRIR